MEVLIINQLNDSIINAFTVKVSKGPLAGDRVKRWLELKSIGNLSPGSAFH